jgi:hypothetical protein
VDRAGSGIEVLTEFAALCFLHKLLKNLILGAGRTCQQSRASHNKAAHSGTTAYTGPGARHALKHYDVFPAAKCFPP